jgi:hypothetical protein
MKTLRMMRNIAALFIVVTALAASKAPQNSNPPPPQIPSWCVQNLNPCCCRRGKTWLSKRDPYYQQCVTHCETVVP